MEQQQSAPPPVADIRDRLNAIVSWAVPGRGRFRQLEERSGISQESWKATWHNKQRPTADMIQVVARAWPEYAFWMVTGVTDQFHGHQAPENVDPYPEPRCSPRTVAERYFTQQIEMRRRRDSGEPELYEHILQLRALSSSRDLDEVSCEAADQAEEQTAIASAVQRLPSMDSDAGIPSRDPSRPTLTARFLAELQSQRELNDQQMAALLGLTLEELEAAKSGGLEAGVIERIFGSWAYDKIRDALFKVLPGDWARNLRRRDIERGHRRIQKMIGKS